MKKMLFVLMMLPLWCSAQKPEYPIDSLQVYRDSLPINKESQEPVDSLFIRLSDLIYLSIDTAAFPQVATFQLHDRRGATIIMLDDKVYDNCTCSLEWGQTVYYWPNVLKAVEQYSSTPIVTHIVCPDYLLFLYPWEVKSIHFHKQ